MQQVQQRNVPCYRKTPKAAMVSLTTDIREAISMQERKVMDVGVEETGENPKTKICRGGEKMKHMKPRRVIKTCHHQA